MRPLLSNQAKYAAAVRSYVRQNCGHQTGTPAFAMKVSWVRSKIPWPVSATTTAQSDQRKPETATARKNAPTSNSRRSVWKRGSSAWDLVNDRIKHREGFRPFAGAVPLEMKGSQGCCGVLALEGHIPCGPGTIREFLRQQDAEQRP